MHRIKPIILAFLLVLGLPLSALAAPTYTIGDSPLDMSYQGFKAYKLGDGALYVGCYVGEGPGLVYRSTDNGLTYDLFARTKDIVESVSSIVEWGGQKYALTERPCGEPTIYAIPENGGTMTPYTTIDTSSTGGQYLFAYDPLESNVVNVANGRMKQGGYLIDLEGTPLTRELWVGDEPGGTWTSVTIPGGYLSGYSVNQDFRDRGGVARYDKATESWSLTPLDGGVIQLQEIGGAYYASTIQGSVYASTDYFQHYTKVFQADEHSPYDMSYYLMNGRNVYASASGSIYVDGKKVLDIDTDWLGVVPIDENTLAGFTSIGGPMASGQGYSYPIQIKMNW